MVSRTQARALLLFGITPALLLLWLIPLTRAVLTGPIWQPVSVPIGSPVSTVHFHPLDAQVVYAGGVTGFYRSVNGGRTWHASGAGLPADARITCLATSPTTPHWLFASTEEYGIFRSKDKGRSWERIASIAHACLIVSPHYRTDRTAFAWWNYYDPQTRHQVSGAVKLVGRTPFTLPVALERPVITPIYDDDGPNVDLFTLWGHGYRFSTDGGKTWSEPRSVTETAGIRLNVIAVSPSFGEDHTLFVGANPIAPYTFEGAPGLFKSTDGGQTWHLMSKGLPEKHAVVNIALAPDYHEQDAGRRSLYAFLRGASPYAPVRVFRSADGGRSWEEIRVTDEGQPLMSVLHMAIPPDYAVNPVLLAAAEWGIYRSQDRGATWKYASQGIMGGYVSAIAQTGQTLYIRAWEPLTWADKVSDRIFRSEDGGHTWARAVARGLPPAYVTRGPTRDLVPPDMTVLPDGTLFAWGMESWGVYRSTDKGETWAPVNQGLTITVGTRVFTATIYFLDFFARTPYTLYAAGGSSLYRSTDLGEHWMPLSLPVTGNVDGLAVADWPSPYVYVFFQEGYLLRSRDGGQSWEDLSTNLIPHNLPWKYLNSRTLLVHPTQPGVVYVGGGYAVPPPYTNRNRLYVSEDGGEHWQDLSAHLPADRTLIRGLYISAQQPDRLWLLMEDTRYRTNPADRRAHRLFISDDGGETWVELRLDPRLRRAGIRQILLSSPDRLLVASGGYGLWSWNFTWTQPTFLPFVPHIFVD